MWLVARRVAGVYTGLCAGQAAHGDAFGSLAGLLDEDAAYRASEQLAEDRQYWSEALAARPEAGSLTLSSHPPAKSASFVRATVVLPRSCEQRLRTLAARSRASLARVMTAATAIFLHRLGGAGDVVLGLPVAARSEASRLIPGMASNVLPLRLAVHPAMTVLDVVGQASQRTRSGLQHQRYQLVDMRREVGGDVDDRALFGLSINVMPFNYGFSFAGCRATAHNLSLGPVEDLSISVYDRSDGGPLRVDFDVNPALHTTADAQGFRQRFLRLLNSMADADCSVGNLAMLEPAERDTIVAALERHRAGGGAGDRGRIVRRAGAAHAGGRAVIAEDRYAELRGARRATPTSWRIICAALGVGPETVVGLCVERSPEMVIGLLGILKAGGAYLPLDPNYPRERLAFMLADAGVSGAGDAIGAARSAARHDGLTQSCSSTPTHRRLHARQQPRRRSISIRAIRPMSSTPRVRPECRRRVVVEHASLDQQDAGAWPRLRCERAFPCGAVDFAGVRSLDRAGVAAFHRWWGDGRYQRHRSGIAYSILAADEARRRDVHQLRAFVF